MRTVLAALILVAATNAHAQMSAAQCRTYLDTFGELRRSSMETQQALADVDLVEFMSNGSAALREAAKPTDAARIRLVAALRDYAALSEEMERHLRECAR